jgi:hypothetical protein
MRTTAGSIRRITAKGCIALLAIQHDMCRGACGSDFMLRWEARSERTRIAPDGHAVLPRTVASLRCSRLPARQPSVLVIRNDLLNDTALLLQ